MPKTTEQISDDNLSKLLRFDPLDFAGNLTGVDYKESKITEALGVGMHFSHSDAKRAALVAAGDSPFGCDLPRYLEIIAEEGFEQVLALPFDGREELGVTPKETLFVYWKPEDGVILCFDTFHGRLNGGKFFYNWKLAAGETERHDVTSSGHWVKQPDESMVWVGDHDCREAIRFHLRQLRTVGQFVTPWVTRPTPFWLLHYMDYKKDYAAENGRIYDRISAERIAMLPESVRKAIAS